MKMKRWIGTGTAAVFLALIVLAISCPRQISAAQDLVLGSPAPDFKLIDVVSGRSVSSADFSDKKPLLVIFICRHCPYVQHVKKVLAAIGRDYSGQVGVVGISSNDPAAYPEDAPASLKEMARQEGFTFPLLFDESQEVAKAYGAAATPEPFLFDADRRLVYHGQLDETRPRGGREATGEDLRAALDAVLAGRPASKDQKSAVGCSIKWKSNPF